MPQRIELLQLDNAFENDSDGSADSTPYTEKPPKQKDRTKSKPKPKLDQEYSDESATSDNPYSAYQYEFPYQYPYNFFNMPSSTSTSGTETKNKTNKKSSGNTQNTKKSAKEPDKTVVPFISISVAPHQPKVGDIDSQSTQNDDLREFNTEASNESVYSSGKNPSPDQAAYFNYLNTYMPSHHNQDPIQQAQSSDNDKYNQLNSFGSRYPIHYGFNAPSNAANTYGYGYGYPPYNGYSQILGRMPFYNVAPIESMQNVKSHESARSISQKTTSSTGRVSSKKNIQHS